MKIKTLSDIKNIKVSLMDTTNPKFSPYIHRLGSITYEQSVITFSSLTLNFHTSYIKKLEINNNIFTFTTRNSIYKFRAENGNYPNIVIEIDRTDIENQIKFIEQAFLP